MYKQKTNKSFKKRYKITAGGKVKARQAGKKHLNAKMSGTMRRRLRGFKTLAKANVARVKDMLPYA